MKVNTLSNVQFKNFIVNSTIRLVLCFYILFPLFSFAAFNSYDNPPKAENPTQIFISSQTVIVGVDDIHNAKIVNEITKENDLGVSKDGNKKNVFKKSALVLKKDLEKTQKKNDISELKTKENYFMTSSQNTNTNFIQKYGKVSNALMSSQNLSKHVLFIVQKAKHYRFLIVQLKKQKFYTSLSYLQFGKNRSSSLRAPPVL